MILRVRCALFTSQWQGSGLFFELSSPAKAAGIPKADLCASCLVPCQGTKDRGTIQLAALSVMWGEEQCCTGCVALAALRNWICVYLFLVVGRIFNGERFSSPRLPVQSFEIFSMCSEGEGLASEDARPLLFASCSTDAAFAWVSGFKIICHLPLYSTNSSKG